MYREIVTILKSIAPDSDFENCKDFFVENLIDSFGIMSLITLLEEKFHIFIKGEDISEHNFKNVECIDKLVKKYLRS